MKKYLLLAALTVCGSSSFSQIRKGQWLAGGNTSFNYNKSYTGYLSTFYESTVWQLSPDAGYFLANKLAAGLKMNFRFANNHVEEGIKYSQELSLSPFLRYYFLPKSEKVNLFAEVGYIYGSTKYRFLDPFSSTGDRSYTMTRKMKGYAIAAGPVIFLNSKTALELTVSFTKNGDLPYYNYNRSVTIMGGVGFQIHLAE